jgi:hypothetical protein
MLRSTVRAIMLGDTVREIPPSDVLFFSHDVDNSETLNGRAYGRLLDTVLESCVERGLTVAHVSIPYSVFAEEQTYFKRYRMNRSRFVSDLARKAKLLELTKRLSERMFRNILLRSGAKIIFSIGLPASLSIVAKALGLTTVEVLHGKGLVESDRPAIDWSNRAEEELPSAFLALDEVSYRTFVGIGFKNVRVLYASDFWLDRINNPQRGNIPSEWEAPGFLTGGRTKVVLVSLQWRYRGGTKEFEGILDNGYIPASVIKAIEKSHEDVQWLLRLHPVLRRSNKKREAEFFLESLSQQNPNVEWQISSTVPLPSVLSISTRHVTMRSGATVDASQMGIPTALLCPTIAPGKSNAAVHRALREKGLVRRFDIADDEGLLSWIRLSTGKKWLVFEEQKPISLTMVLDQIESLGCNNES